MTFKEQYLAFAKILSNHYSQEEISSFFNLLTAHLLGWNRFETHQNNDTQITREHQQYFSEAIKRLTQQEPIQYVIGETEFYGLPFKVDRHTLIPRPETEELVAWILEVYQEKTELQVLDVGTGSGCIAISIAASLKQAKVTGLDISEGAIAMAENNALLNNVSVAFKQTDILNLDALQYKYDVIVSNPPYVRDSEKIKMMPNVLKYEPESALFVSDANPLQFYKKIAELAQLSLKPSGTLFFEINEYLATQMVAMLEDLWYTNIIVKSDMYGKARMIKCNLKQCV